MDAVSLEKAPLVWHARDIRAGLPTTSEGEIGQISLSVRAGEKIALLGPESGGKALLFRVLAGLRPI